MDVHCLSWLYNMSSNSSVQRVVMQSLSNIPLAEAKAIHKLLPSLSTHIRSALSDYVTPDRRLAWERLFRALNRFDDWTQLSPVQRHQDPVPNTVSFLFHRGRREDAAQFLRQQIVEPTVELDALAWARILRNVLWGGVGWLDVGDNSSQVWTSFRDWFLDAHVCHKAVHDSKTVWTVEITCDDHIHWEEKHFFLHIVEPVGVFDHPNSTSDGANFRVSMVRFLCPSFCHFLTSNVLDGIDIPMDLPGEMRLHFALLSTLR